MPHRTALCALGLTALLVAEVRGAEDPFDGRWQLDPERSKLPGKPPISETFSYDIGAEGEVRFEVEEVRESGRVTALWVGRFDGRDYPMTGAPGRDTLAMARIDDRVILGVYKKQGQVTYAFVRSLSADGRTMISRILGSGAQGQPINLEIIAEKRP